MDNQEIVVKQENDKFYMEFAGQVIEILPWEVSLLRSNPEKVYDVIISHTRKFNFNTAEDSGELL